jgi:hypothetical protein
MGARRRRDRRPPFQLSECEAEIVTRFLQRVADAAERHADRLAYDADTSAHEALAVPPPALWA